MHTRIAALMTLALLCYSFVEGASGIARQSGPAATHGDAAFNVKWIHGAEDCSRSTDPPIQVYRFDADTYIFRESKCLNFEGPFMYLLIGRKKALLVDSGAGPPAGKALPIGDVVQQALTEWGASHHKSKSDVAAIELIVAHSHGHTDHTYGDSQFDGQPHTFVVKPDVDSVKTFFKLDKWPEGSARLDLGGRVLTILPAPGHQKAHLAIYDSKTHLLLTGDMLYPGLLTVDDWPQYRNSVKRLSDFAESHKVSYILGAHIEMMTTPAKMYPLGSTYQPDEHILQMTVKDLADLQKACDALGDKPVRDVHDNFIIYPRKH